MEKTPLVAGGAEAGTEPPPVSAASAFRGKLAARMGSMMSEKNADLATGDHPITTRAFIVVWIGVACGLVAAAYGFVLDFLLDLLWETWPEKYAAYLPFEILWIPLLCIPLSALVALPVKTMGDPGDLRTTIGDVHKDGFIDIGHALPMALASQASILGGGSLGPEAPLVAICAALGGWISQNQFGASQRPTIRKHTMCGMACALAAFFGVPIGGAVFAMEVCHNFGLEYYEHFVEAVSSAVVCMFVFRTISGAPIGAIWSFTGPDNNLQMSLDISPASVVLIGVGIGLLGAITAVAFATWHRWLLKTFNTAGLLRPENIFARTAVAGLAIATVGMFIPYTLFWGEFEFQVVANGMASTALPHAYPTKGISGLDLTDGTFLTPLIIAIGKFIAISFTVVGGYRGGFIFPLFMAGSALGRALVALFPSLPPAMATLSYAAALNVAITRTPLGTSLVLVALSAEPNAITPVITAALVSVFLTHNLRFLPTQQKRADF